MPVNQKLENLLNLSLDTTAEERSRSSELETGYNPEEQTWELIVKYSRSLGCGAGALVPWWRKCSNEYSDSDSKRKPDPADQRAAAN